MTPSKHFSSVVTSLRFPLILLVVLIHTPPISPSFEEFGGSQGLYAYVAALINWALTRVAVPAFFVFSGYYTFKGKNLEQTQTYLTEIKKRVWTLIVPYLLWNLIYIPVSIARESLAAYVGLPRTASFDFEWIKLVDYLWFAPINFPLWFMRDLIALTLITPVIHFALRTTRGYFVPLLFLLCLFVEEPFHIIGAEPRSLLFYSIGALFAMKGWDPIAKLRPLAIPSFAVWAVGTFVLPCFFMKSYYHMLELPYLACSIVAWILMFTTLVERAPKVTAWLEGMNKYVFFIYAAHTILIIGFARSFVARISFLSGSNIGLILSYFIIAGITLVTVLIAYWVLARIAPKVLSILCGGRAS